MPTSSVATSASETCSSAPAAAEGASSRLLYPEDEGSVWEVMTGCADLFVQKMVDGEYGARHYMTSVSAGQALFGISMQQHGGLTLVAALHPGTEVKQMSRALFLRRRTLHPTHSPSALLRDWVESLYAVAAAPLVPESCEVFQAGETVHSTDAPRLICSADPFLFVKVTEGTCRLYGKHVLSPYDLPLALPRAGGTWVECLPQSKAEVLTLHEVQRGDAQCAWLDQVHRFILEAVRFKMSEVDTDWRSSLETQRQSDAALAHRAFVQLTLPLTRATATVVGGAEVHDSLVGACHVLGEQIGIRLGEPTQRYEGRGISHFVEEICRMSRVRHRQVVLTGEWWKQDSGPMLATRKEDGSAVALLFGPLGRYSLVDTRQGSRVRIDSTMAASLHAAAFTFYRGFPLGAVHTGTLARFVLASIRQELLLVLGMGVLGGCLSLVFPIATGIVFDSVIPGAERGQLFQLAALMATAALSSTLLTLVRSLATLRLEAKTDITAQAAMWDRLLRLPAPFFRQFSSGDLALRSLAMNQIRSILSNATLNSILSGVFSLFNLLLLFAYNWALAALTVALASAFLAVAAAAGAIQLKHMRGTVRARGRISAMLLQFINGIAKLRISGAESRAFAEWANAFAEQKSCYLRSRRVANRMAVLQAVFPILAVQILFLCVSRGLSDARPSAMTTGTFLAFLAAFLQFITCAVQFTSAIPALISTVPILERAMPILQAVPEVQESKSAAGVLRGGVEVSHISFRYERNGPLVLQDVSFAIKPGEFVAITGPSGSGKSTLLRLLLGFETPESGSVSYDDQDLDGLDVQALRQQLGVVLQSGRLVSGTILDNIIGSLPLTQADALEAARMAGFDQDIKAMPMGLHTFVNDGGAGLSGGQRQRLMIARAIVNKPRILFFDEATSALDNRTQAIVSQSLSSLRATRVVIAHRLSTIQKADRILVFDGGAVVQSGTFEELSAAPGLFRTLVQRQVL